MTITKNFNVYKGVPYLMTVQANGYYQNQRVLTSTKPETIDCELEPFTPITHTIEPSINRTTDVVYFDPGQLPNRYFSPFSCGCFMPYGQTYDRIEVDYTKKLLSFDGVTNDNGVVSDFSSSAKVGFDYTFPEEINSAKLIFKARIDSYAHDNVLLGSDSNYLYVRWNPSKVFTCYCNNTSMTGKTTIKENQYYWFAVVYDGAVYRGYILLDDSYNLQNLPDFSEWSFEWSTTKPFLQGSTFTFGFSQKSPNYFFNGTIDLNNTFIEVNDEKVFSYPLHLTWSYKGCFWNYEDNGKAVRLNAFAHVKEDGSYDIILSPDQRVDFGDDSLILWIANVDIPEHQAYRYEGGRWIPK